MDDITEQKKFEIECERVILAKKMFLLKVIEIEMQRRAYIRANKTWAQKIDDFLFDW